MFYLDQQRATREERNKIRERPKDTLNIGQHAARFERDDDHQAASPPIFFGCSAGPTNLLYSCLYLWLCIMKQ